MGTLRALIEQASDMAAAMYDPDDVLTPHFIAEAADGSITMVAVMASGRDLDLFRNSVPKRLAADGCRRWVFFSEAYSAKYRAGDVKVEPVDHPERIEVVVFDGYDVPGNRTCRATRQILRLDGSARLMPLVVNGGTTGFVPSMTSREGRR